MLPLQLTVFISMSLVGGGGTYLIFVLFTPLHAE